MNLDIAVLTGVATTYVTELLKSSLVPVAFQRYPRITAFVVSLAASAYVAIQQGVTFRDDWTNAAQFVAVTFLVATVTYNNVTKK